MATAPLGRQPQWIVLPAFVLVYALAYLLGRLLYLEPETVSALWPASGVSLGALLLCRPRRWPLLLAVQALCHLILAYLDGGVPFAIGVTVADIIETLLGALLIRRWCGGRFRLDEPGHIVRLIGGATIAAIPSAIIGTVTVWWVFGSTTWLATARVWLLADLIGMLLVAPAIIAIASLRRELRIERHLELAAAILVMAGSAACVAYAQPGVGMILQPALLWIPLLWIGLRAGPAMTAVAGAVVALMLVGGADLGRGPFVATTQTPTDLSLAVQIFTAVFGLSCVLIAATASGRRQALLAIRETASRLQITLDSIGDGVIATDRDGRVELLNPIAATMTGWQAEEAHGQPIDTVFAIVSAHTGETVDSPVTRALTAGHIVGLSNQTMLIDRHGGRRHIADSAAPIRDAAGTVVGAVLVFRDVSERLELESRVRQTEKLEVIGQLSSGIAHDLNNMLGGVLGGTELLARRLGDDEQHAAPLRLIRTAVERMRAMNTRMLSFARSQRPIAQIFCLDEAVTETVDLARHGLDHRFQIDIDLSASDGLVEADRGQFQSCLLNLLVNARDAMAEEGGTILVSSRIDADRLVVVVRDSGCGMPPEVVARAFEPFFTTKESGKGTGLGLHAARRFTSQNNGTISIDSAPQEGTTIMLSLPVAGQAAARVSSSADHGRRVLVVDDDATLREAICQQLEDAGYTTIEACDGFAGLQRLEQDPVDSLVLDVVMPRMDGLEMLATLRQEQPQLPVVVMSGRLPDGDHSGLLQHPRTRFLAKPFAIEQLCRLLDDLHET